MPDAVTDSIQTRASRTTSQVGAITAFAHDLTTVLYRRDAESGDARKDLEAVVARHATRIRLSRAQVGEVVATALEETRELFLTADVRVDALRMQQLADAACTALGVTALGDDAGDSASESGELPEPSALRERLMHELEVRVAPASGCDLGQVLLLALEAMLRGTPFDRVVACVLSPDRTRLRARSGLGLGMERLLAEFDFPMTPQGGAIPAALLTAKAVYVPRDRAMTVLEQRMATRLGIAQFGLFPIVVDGQIVGCLYGDRSHAEPAPDVDALVHVHTLTEHVVRAIELRRTEPAARPGRTPDGAISDAQASRLPAETKASLVLRLLQGETLTSVAAASGISPVTLELWRTEFLAGAMARLGAPPAH